MMTTYPRPTDDVAAMTRADGTTEAHSTDHGRIIDAWENVKAAGAIGGGTGADDTAIIQSVMDACSGKVCYLPKGEYAVTGLTLRVSNMELRGAGKGRTILKKKANSAVSPLLQTDGNNYSVENITIRDMTLDWNADNQSALNSATLVLAAFTKGLVGRATVQDCEFKNGPSSGVSLTNVHDVDLIHNTYQGSGSGLGEGAVGTSNCYNIRSISEKVRYTYAGYQIGTGSRNIRIIDPDVDLGWWFVKSINSGTGTYTSTTLTDSGFPAYSPYSTWARAMPTLRSGTAGSSTWITQLHDASALFTGYGVLRGHIVRSGTKFAIVYEVTSNTVLEVEGWLDSTTYEPVSPPVAGDSYTLYGQLLGIIASNTATEITVTRWQKMDGADSTPANGTPYEIFDANNYPVHAVAGTTDIKVIGGILQRSFGDICEMQGTDYEIIGTTVYGGSDLGIAFVGSRGKAIGVTADYCGASGIWHAVNTTDTKSVGCTARNSPWINNANQQWLGDITIEDGATRAHVVGCNVVNLGATTLGRHGIGVAGDATAVVDCVIADNVGAGHTISEYRFSGGANANTVKFENNSGSVSYASGKYYPVLADAATVLVDAAKGDFQVLTTANSRAIEAPSNPAQGQSLTIQIGNSSGGNITPTYAASYVLVGGAGPTIATGKTQSVTFTYDGSFWKETHRTSGDV